MFPNWLDVLVSVLIVLGAYRGFRRGLIREGMAFAGLLGGMVIASHWQADAAGMVAPFVGAGGLADALGYAGVVLLVMGVATVTTLLVRRLLHVLLVGWVDTVGGAVFGAIQGAIVAALLLFLFVKLRLLGLDESVQRSEMAMLVLGILPGAVGLLPDEFSGLVSFFDVAKSGAPKW